MAIDENKKKAVKDNEESVKEEEAEKALITEEEESVLSEEDKENEESEVSEDGAVLLSMSYSSYIDYAHFNQITFYYGTVGDAVDKGFAVDRELVDPKGETISFDDIDDINARHIIITGDKVTIAAPYKISYMTKGVVLTDKKEADLSDVSADVVQLLLSK